MTHFKTPQDGNHMMPYFFGPRPENDKISGWYKDVTMIVIPYVTDEKILKSIIPEKFALLNDPIVTITYACNKDIDWLAGRSYNLVSISIKVKFEGKVDKEEGTLNLVMWENLTDPILTGRELQGIPKIYADIKDHQISDETVSTSMSHYDNTILDISISNMTQLDDKMVAVGEIGLDYLMINGSNEGRNIDTVRTLLQQYCSSVSMQGGRKVVIVDEADYMNAESVQPALRGFIEKFSANVSFIFTCNFRNRIIDPIHSRCSVIEFVIPRSEKPKLGQECLVRVKEILTAKGIKFDEKVLVELVLKHFPDMRRVINELQRYAAGGVIDVGILAQIGEINLLELMKALKGKHFSEVRKWVTQNVDNDPVRIFRKIYDGIHDYLKDTSIPQAVLIIAEYQYKSAFVADQEINLVACLTEMMVDCEFK